MRTPASEPGRFHTVSKNHVLAAFERAQRHDTAMVAPVTLRRIAVHLGFTSGAHTTRHLGPLARALEQARSRVLARVRR